MHAACSFLDAKGLGPPYSNRNALRVPTKYIDVSGYDALGFPELQRSFHFANGCNKRLDSQLQQDPFEIARGFIVNYLQGVFGTLPTFR